MDLTNNTLHPLKEPLYRCINLDVWENLSVCMTCVKFSVCFSINFNSISLNAKKHPSNRHSNGTGKRKPVRFCFFFLSIDLSFGFEHLPYACYIEGKKRFIFK